MDDPLLAIVDSAMQRRILNNILDLGDWEDELRIFAPGYTELEAQGRATNYDLANLSTDVLEGQAHHTRETKERQRTTGSYVDLCRGT